MLSVSYWEDKLYPTGASRCPVHTFVEQVGHHVRPEMTVLDIGAGAGERSVYDFRGKCHEMVGVDLDPRVVENPLLDRGKVCTATEIPLPDNSVDLAFSIYVCEHVEDPTLFMQEVSRVLKPGGQFLSLAPNRVHYVPLIASLTPTSFHKWVNRKRGRDDDDTFPTFYRLNSTRTFRKHASSAGLSDVQTESVEVCPNYLRFALPFFLVGAAYERLVNSSQLFARFRVNFIFSCRKPG